MVATLSFMPVARITANITRIAKIEGISASRRAEPLRNTSRKAAKMIATVSAKLSTSVGTRLSLIFA